jgi:hypothetical protein
MPRDSFKVEDLKRRFASWAKQYLHVRQELGIVLRPQKGETGQGCSVGLAQNRYSDFVSVDIDAIPI